MDADFLLIHRMKNGDEDAVELFVRKYYPAVRNYCRSHTRSDAAAEDLTQETFERFFQSFHQYRHCGKLANYLYVIAGNLCRDNYRKKQELLLEEMPETGENPLDAAELRMDVEDAVRRLPDEMREVIILHYFQGLKLKTVAEIIGIGLPLVKYRLKKAKERLKSYMEEVQDDG